MISILFKKKKKKKKKKIIKKYRELTLFQIIFFEVIGCLKVDCPLLNIFSSFFTFIFLLLNILIT